MTGETGGGGPVEAAVGRMTAAARDFLAALTAAQRRTACFAMDELTERRRWFNAPTVQGGIALAALSPAQQRLAQRLAATGLSEGGYVLAAHIMGHENALDASEGWNLPGMFEAYPGTEHARGRDPLMFFFSVFGDPGADVWGWRAGGHHIALNYTIAGGRLAPTPHFFGSNPAEAPLVGGQALRLLGAEADLGLALLNTLDDDQRQAAVISPVAPFDVTQGGRAKVEDGTLMDPAFLWGFPVPDGSPYQSATNAAGLDQMMAKYGWNATTADAVRFTLAPKGLPAARMAPDQRELLMTLIRQYIDRMPAEVAEAELAKMHDAGFGGVHFAWAGPAATKFNYYRIQGPTFLAEFDNVQREGNHCHTLWRDPEGDFGIDLLAQHHAQEHP